MNGAESLVRTLVGGGVEVCFTNPGTSEMHFVAALDRVDGIRCVLGLFEGVVTGAADGYARMADKPAATLLHLGPGLGNGLANLHNAKKAFTPVVNVVGDHATYHLGYDAPLAADIEGIAWSDEGVCLRAHRQLRCYHLEPWTCQNHRRMPDRTRSAWIAIPGRTRPGCCSRCNRRSFRNCLHRNRRRRRHHIDRSRHFCCSPAYTHRPLRHTVRSTRIVWLL